MDPVVALMQAVFANDVEQVRHLIQAGVDVNASEDAAGITALHHAVQQNLTEIVQLLLLAGADPLLENDEGESPYALAIRQKKDDILKTLRAYLSNKYDFM